MIKFLPYILIYFFSFQTSANVSPELKEENSSYLLGTIKSIKNAIKTTAKSSINYLWGSSGQNAETICKQIKEMHPTQADYDQKNHPHVLCVDATVNGENVFDRKCLEEQLPLYERTIGSCYSVK